MIELYDGYSVRKAPSTWYPVFMKVAAIGVAVLPPSFAIHASHRFYSSCLS